MSRPTAWTNYIVLITGTTEIDPGEKHGLCRFDNQSYRVRLQNQYSAESGDNLVDAVSAALQIDMPGVGFSGRAALPDRVTGTLRTSGGGYGSRIIGDISATVTIESVESVEEKRFPQRRPKKLNGGRPTNEERGIPKSERLVLYTPAVHHEKIRAYAEQLKAK